MSAEGVAAEGVSGEGVSGELGRAGDDMAVALDVRGPFDYEGLFVFLAARAMPGVEEVAGLSYRRSWRVSGRTIRIRVDAEPSRHRLRLHTPRLAAPLRAELQRRVRRVFDLDRNAAEVDAALSGDPLLAGDTAARPGVRVPGAFDGFETAVRAVLGQQVSVAAARTLATRLIDRLATGEPTTAATVPTFPSASELAKANLCQFGMPQSRCDTLVRLACAVEAGDVDLEGGMAKSELISALRPIKGIGPWTAEYIAMRCLHDPDCFPVEDLVLRREIGGGAIAPVKTVRERAESWRPWRSYAVIRLWRRASLRSASLQATTSE